MAIQFREATEGDVEVLVRYNCQLAWETEQKTLDEATVRRGVSTALKLSPEVRYFVAESAGEVLGQLMLTREWSDWRNGWMSWLQSVYVRQQSRGQGVFRGLLNYAMETLKRTDHSVCLRLYVEHENSSAMDCYTRLQFEKAGYLVMERSLVDSEKETH